MNGAGIHAHQESSPIEAVLRRDRWVTVAGLVSLTALSWAYLFYLAADMSGMEMGGGAPLAIGAELAPWAAGDFVFMFLMWSIMMVAMMLPSASPMVLLHAAMNRQQGAAANGAIGTAAFVAGYLVAWAGFSAGATLLQWALERLALVAPLTASATTMLGAALLLAAGLYQLTPWKDTCLRHCRSPVQFLMQHWRGGTAGAFRMGLEHGAYCIGCCWLLMALLFVFGVMNLAWIAALSILVLTEKVAPRGELVARLSAIGLIVAAIALLVAG